MRRVLAGYPEGLANVDLDEVTANSCAIYVLARQSNGREKSKRSVEASPRRTTVKHHHSCAGAPSPKRSFTL